MTTDIDNDRQVLLADLRRQYREANEERLWAEDIAAQAQSEMDQIMDDAELIKAAHPDLIRQWIEARDAERLMMSLLTAQHSAMEVNRG